MSTSLEKRVSKFIIFIFIYLCFVIKAQTPAIDLEEKSVRLLQTKVAYTAPKQSLKETLKSLSFENNINIFYSSTVLGETKASPVVAGTMELGPLLSMLLQSSGFDYVVIGQSIAIVEKTSESTPKDSLKTSPQSPLTLLQEHIISEKTLTFDHISPKDRRRVRALLLKELNTYGLELEETKDTIIVKPIVNSNRYGIALLGGIVQNGVHTRSLVNYDWVSELRYKAKTAPSLLFSLQGSVHKKSYFIFVGCSFESIKTEITWVEMKKNGAQVELPAPSKAEKLKYLNATDQLLMLSLPLGLGYTIKLHEDHIFAPMLSLGLFAVLNSKSDPSKYSDYYKVKNPGTTYSEKTNPLGMSSTLALRYGYTYQKRYVFIADAGYSLALSPFMTNSFFKSSKRGVSISIGINYWLR